MKFVISGYYGFGNNGDDALLLAITKEIKSLYPDAEITVLSKSPKKTEKQYHVRSVNRYNVFSVLNALHRCDMLISGGGTLVQDATSTKSLIYYLTVIRIAKFFKKKVMLYANGIGPLTSFKNIERTKDILNTVDLITLRDKNSLAELEQIGVRKEIMELTADPAFLLEPDGNGSKILETYGVAEDGKLMCISLRNWKDMPKDFSKIIAGFCDYAFEKHGIYTVLLPMQVSVDYKLASDVKNKMKNKATIVSGKYPVESVLSVIDKMYVCVGMRLHTLIYSASRIVPAIGIVYDPKVKGFLDYINEERYVDLSEISEEGLCKLLDEICENHSEVTSHMRYAIGLIKKKAKRNGELMQELLCGGENK